MTPLLEVLNGNVLAEPGTWFKREAERIWENLHFDLQLEEAKEELKMQNLTDNIKHDVGQMKEDMKDVIDDLTGIDQKIEQTTISCWPNVKPLMDEELLIDINKKEIPSDLMDDNNMFQQYIKGKFDKTWGEFRKVMNKVWIEWYDDF